jgi:uncharacterized membrane protein
MTLLSAESLFVAGGGLLLAVAVHTARASDQPARWGSVLFWGLLGAVFVFGKLLPPAVVGGLVLVMVALAAGGAVKPPLPTSKATAARAERERSAAALGNRIFWPALLIPATAVVGSLTLERIAWGDVRLVDPRHATLVALGLGALVALVAGLRVTRARPITALAEGGRLLQTIGWALVLPQMLAALGALFAKAGVGEVVAGLVQQSLPTQHRFVAVLAYCLGMMLFTICMGNAFAAFAVITGGIGLPLVMQQHGGNPAIVASIGMLAGYCGTLLTPMAANFNIVPAMLLEMRDRHGVIKAQVPLALAIFAANVALMYWCAFRF